MVLQILCDKLTGSKNKSSRNRLLFCNLPNHQPIMKPIIVAKSLRSVLLSFLFFISKWMVANHFVFFFVFPVDWKISDNFCQCLLAASASSKGRIEQPLPLFVCTYVITTIAYVCAYAITNQLCIIRLIVSTTAATIIRSQGEKKGKSIYRPFLRSLCTVF